MRRVFPLIVALVAAGGVLLIDDRTAQVVFLVGVCGLALLSDRLPGRWQSEGSTGRWDWTLIVPVVLALVVARLAFDSDDARLAALFVLAVAFSAVWRQLRIGERLRGDRPDSGGPARERA